MTTSSEAKSLVFESGADGRLLSQFTLRPSKYDIAVAALSTTTLVSFFCLISSVAIWIGNKPGKPRGIDVSMLPAVMLDGDGGWEDGTPGATPNVESPEDPSLDPSLAAEASSDVTELMNIVETVQAFDDSLTGSTQFSSSVSELGVAAVSGVANDYTGLRNAGVPGSAEGTGGRPLGSGGPGRGGRKREQRWVVEFDDVVDLNTYASKLQFFGIELAAKFEREGRLVYLTQLTAPRPAAREVNAVEAKQERRMFMLWSEGSEARRDADQELFRRAGIDVSQAQLLHFYPAETELKLATLEQDYLKRPPQEIRQTVFAVRGVTNRFEFYVVSQR